MRPTFFASKFVLVRHAEQYGCKNSGRAALAWMEATGPLVAKDVRAFSSALCSSSWPSVQDFIGGIGYELEVTRMHLQAFLPVCSK